MLASASDLIKNPGTGNQGTDAMTTQRLIGIGLVAFLVVDLFVLFPGVGLVLASVTGVVLFRLGKSKFPNVQFRRSSNDRSGRLGLDFSGMSLKGQDLSHRNLRGASFQNAILAGADFTNANLEGANFNRSILIGANLTNVNLGGADLTGAALNRAISSGICGTPAHLPDGWELRGGVLVKE